MPGCLPEQSLNEATPDNGFLMRFKPNATVEEVSAICQELEGSAGDTAPRFRGACTGQFNAVSL